MVNAAKVPQPFPQLYALVPCAGVGERAAQAGPKQYAQVAGHSVVAHTLAALVQVARLRGTLVMLSAADQLFERHAPLYAGWVSRQGGASRAQTVARGLHELLARGAQPHDWVLVHDAARCLVRPELINTLIDACLNDPVGGLLALPVADTLKLSAEGRATQTLDRSATWQAQTPQMFRIEALRTALTQAESAVITDEASAMEALGLAPKLVLGSLENFKLTYPADFELAHQWLSCRGSVKGASQSDA
jgi:2-C-methyl-D-erythritol 4-phosphate cytidylyltransferase